MFSTNRITKWLNARLEYKVAKYADVIIHTNEIIKDVWVQRYGDLVRDKIEVLPLCTDENIIAIDNISSKPGKFKIIHAGNTYNKRNLRELILALHLLNNKKTNLQGKLIIQIYGNVEYEDLDLISKYNLNSLFQIEKRKSYSEIQKFIKEADALLVIDASEPETNVFFPSKICEYFSHQKPIIGITSKYSTTRTLLSQTGHFVCGINENISLSSYLEDLIMNNKKPTFDRNFYKNLLPESIAESYLKILKRHNII